MRMTTVETKGNLRQLLLDAGLRPTRQRVALAGMLFLEADRHIAAEDLHRQAVENGVPVSLATVYNTLHQFTHAGLLRILSVEGQRTYFDTNTSSHHHFYIEKSGELFDIDGGICLAQTPQAPEGMEISRIDVIVRLAEKR